MNAVTDKSLPQHADIKVTVYFVDDTSHTQSFPLDMSDRVQRFIDWYRKPGKKLVWTWSTSEMAKVRMFQHKQIEFVDISGFIEPDGRSSRWYERLIDKVRARMMF